MVLISFALLFILLLLKTTNAFFDFLYFKIILSNCITLKCEQNDYMMIQMTRGKRQYLKDITP